MGKIICLFLDNKILLQTNKTIQEQEAACMHNVATRDAILIHKINNYK